MVSDINIDKILNKYNVDKPHVYFVEKISLHLFSELQPLHNLDEKSRQILSHSTLLHDLGHFINEKTHNKSSRYIILNDSILNSYSAMNRQLISLIAYNHRKNIHKNTYKLPSTKKDIVLKLSAIIRLADSMGYNGDINITSVKINTLDVVLKIKGYNNYESLKKRFEKRKELFLFVYNKELVLENSGGRI